MVPIKHYFNIKGMVGISITSEWGDPVDITSQKDIEAAERYIQFNLGWFANPIFNGDYPQVMKDCIGKYKIIGWNKVSAHSTHRCIHTQSLYSNLT